LWRRCGKGQNPDAKAGFFVRVRNRISSAAAGVLLTCLAAAAALIGGGQSAAPRQSFVIATGSTGGTYFPIGEAIAAIVSHPPGVYRCEKPGVCGPPGLIASVRTSPGTLFNVLAVNAHTVDAALAQSDVVAEAVAGTGAFRKHGKQSNLRALASLYPEEVHLVASTKAKIHSVSDLRGKRVSLGPADSGTMVTARTVLAAFRVPLSRLKLDTSASDVAAEKLSKGQIDAMMFVGGAPVPLVRELLEDGNAQLVPIAGDGRARLLKQSHNLLPVSIPAGVYPRTGKVDTVGLRAIFIVNSQVPDSSVYGIARALFNPQNRAMLAGSHRSAQAIQIGDAARDLPAPLHPGAARLYKETGKLPKSAPAKSGKP
jgi:TRAP transporter TAXI family solute receptor